MALSGFSSKCELTIASSAVPQTATNLPIVIEGSNLPSELFGTTGGCKVDGGDIRFATDSTGSVEIPRDIVFLDKTTSTIQVYVKIPSISSTVDTTFYIFWNSPNAAEPAGTSESGSQTVWDDYYGVFHYANIVNDWKGIHDSAGKWANQTPNGTIVTTTGHVEGSLAVELSSTFGIDLSENMTFLSSTNDLMFWCNLLGTSPVNDIANGTNDIALGWQGVGQFGFGWGRAITTPAAVPVSGWHHVWLRNVNGVCRCYVDGVDRTQGTSTTKASEFNTWGKLLETSEWLCSEMRMTRNFNNPVNNVVTMVANETNPTAFISSGTVETVASSSTITIKVVEQDLTPIAAALVFIDEDFAEPYIFNGTTDANGEASFEYSGVNTSATLRVRKYGYKHSKVPFDIQGNDISQSVALTIDPQQT